MANPEPHGFAFDHVGRRPAGMMSFRQRRSKSSAAADTRSSFRLSSLRGALFNGNPQATKNRQQDGRNGANVDKTQSSGVLRSLFSRQVDKSPSSGDLWVDVDLHRPASPSLDNVSVTSSDWTMAETAPAAASRRPELDRSASMEEGNVAMVRRSNSARPATRRPLPMRASSVPHEQEYHAGSGVTAEPVWVQDSDLWTQEAGSQNHARLSADSGHVSYCSAVSMSDEQEPSQMAYQEATTQQLHSADPRDWQRSAARLCNGEIQMQHPEQAVVVSNASCRLSNVASIGERRLPSPSPVPPCHPQPTTSSAAAAAPDVRQDRTHRVISSSTSDMQSVDCSSRVVSPQEVPVPYPQVQSLTRGSTRTADERLGVWASNTTMASSLPSIPRECASGADACQSIPEVTVNTKGWLDYVHRKNNVRSISQSADQMNAVPLTHAGDGLRSLGGGSGLGTLGRRGADGCTTPSRSTLVGSNESFAVTEVSSRQSLNSGDSVSLQGRQNGRRDSSKKRRVTFELQPPTVQRVPDQRLRSRSRSDKQQQRMADNQNRAADPAADDGVEGQPTSRASGSLFSKFRRVVVGGVGALFGLSKQKNSVDESSDTQPVCNGHMPASSFDDMTEMERLATVADRIASERLHSAVLHGKLPTQNGYRGDSRSYGHRKPSSSDPELENIEACLAGLSISSGRTQPERLASRKQQDFASWCGHKSNSVSEELCRIPSNACSSYVQFMPKSMTVPCSIAGGSAVEPPSNCKKPSASSSMGNVLTIECQCGGRLLTESEPVLPTMDSSISSRMMVSERDGLENRSVRGNSHPYAEPSSAMKSASQPTILGGPSQLCQHSSVTALPKLNAELRRSASDASRVREKPQPPPKVFLRSSTTPFREGLLPTSAGVEDFRIRRQVGAAGHGSQNGPVKATVPFLKQLHNGNSDRPVYNATRLPPPPPSTRSFATAGVCGLSVESDTDAQRLTLQELSALVDRELQANARLEMNSDVVEPQQALNPTDEFVNRILNHVDSSAEVISSSTCSRKAGAAVQSKNEVDAQLKSLGFDEGIWNIHLDEILGGSAVGDKKLGVSDDDEEDSASTLTDGSVVTVTSTPISRRRTSPIPSEDDRLQPSNDVVSECGSIESVHSVDDPFSVISKPSALGSSSSYSLPAISDVLETEGDPAHPRCSSANIPVPHTCREDVRGRWRLPYAFSYNQLASGTTAAATCSPYNSKSSGIGSLFDSGSVPNSPL